MYLIASAINSSKMPFLAGAASVYLDGSFIATVKGTLENYFTTKNVFSRDSETFHPESVFRLH